MKSTARGGMSKSNDYRKIQARKDAVLDNCCSSAASIDTAPPIQLYTRPSRTSRAKPLTPTTKCRSNSPITSRSSWLYLLLFTLMRSLANASSELHLANVLDRPLSSTINFDETRPDFQALGSVGPHPLHLVVGEEEREFGDGGSDPSTQVGL